MYTGYNKFNLKILKSICKSRNIKRISKLKKREIVDILICNDSIRKIQRFVRRCFTKIDPISMDKIKYEYVFVSKNGTRQYYDALNLVDYIVSSGDFRDPLTREILQEHHLRELDNIMNTNNIMKPSLFFIKDLNLYDKHIERQNMLIGLENELGRYIELIMEMSNNIGFIHNYEGNEYDKQLYLDHIEYRYSIQVVSILPQIHNYINQMVYLNKDYTRNCILDLVELIKNNCFVCKIKTHIIEELISESRKF